jgi:hypothetical protein
MAMMAKAASSSIKVDARRKKSGSDFSLRMSGKTPANAGGFRKHRPVRLTVAVSD